MSGGQRGVFNNTSRSGFVWFVWDFCWFFFFVVCLGSFCRCLFWGLELLNVEQHEVATLQEER